MFKLNSTRLSLLFLCLLLMCFYFIPSAQSENPIIRNWNSFASIPIQDEGRIKPLETYARTLLLQFSGKRTFDHHPAIAWLAKLLFTPEKTLDDKVFLINSQDIPMAIALTADPHRRYSFNQLKAGLTKIKNLALAIEKIDEKKRSATDQEIIRLYNNLSIYLRLYDAISFALPVEAFKVSVPAVKNTLGLLSDQDTFSFLDIALKAEQINEATKSLEMKKSDAWSEQEKELMRLMREVYRMSSESSASPLVIFPDQDSEHESWLSPWDMMRVGFTDPHIRQEFSYILDMADAYRSGNPVTFDLAVKSYNAAIESRVNPKQKKAIHKIPLENLYNHFNPFFYAWSFYLLAFFTFIFSLIWERPFWRSLGFGLLLLGFIPHVFALGMRITIMARPPVTNLYETFIFVGVITVLLSLITEAINRQWLGIVVGSISGFVFLAIADKFSAEGDTLRMLVAVLNSNFWLSTHVLSITIGYSGCCVAGIMGHVYILQALLRGKDKKALDVTFQHILGTLGFGLTMTFLGTMLGGIWADQSWGRFWGWDPKENGALLIVIWCAILFHARLAKLIHPLGVAVGAALTLIVVMWAWFGVNLLSIGLHSYGFTSGIATNLTIYVLLELIFLSASVLILGRRNIAI